LAKIKEIMGLIQYLKDTQGELRHVAWPTQTQTVVFTVLVVALSIFVSLYLGLFDYIFTGVLERVVGATGGSGLEITTEPLATTTQEVPVLSTSTIPGVN
jgi:preprotein translocase SecE subunit